MADFDFGMPLPPGGRHSLTMDVAELNPYAPRPFALTEAALCLRDSLRLAGLWTASYPFRRFCGSNRPAC